MRKKQQKFFSTTRNRLVWLFIAGLFCIGGFSFYHSVSESGGNVSTSWASVFPGSGNSSGSSIHSLYQLLELPVGELERMDIALLNLICALGLQGSENLDMDACLAKIDDWAQKVKQETEKRLSVFHQNPAKYDHSESVFRMATLVLTLKEDMGIHYDPKAVGNWNFADSRDIFIHGLLEGDRAGTCASLPVLCAAIGRRLGYPIKLTLAKGHIFCRWEDEKERFNIEACCPGVDFPPDEYYKNRPQPIQPVEFHRQAYLKSLTPVEELALFLGHRASCLSDTGRFTEAQIACAWQCHLMPNQVPALMMSLTLADQQLRQTARNEWRVTGQPAVYAIPVDFDGKENFFVWKQPMEQK